MNDKETTKLAETLQEWEEEKIDEGRREGRVEGRQGGQREVLRSLAGQRFGAATGTELAIVLADIEGASELARIGTLIIDCGSGQELLARVRPR